MPQVLDAADVRRWCADGCAALGLARAEIDGLNVFPVPDGDTGTNLLLTMESVADAVGAVGDDLPAVAAALSHGALTGARGNSGMILSQLLRGVADVLADGPADGPALARGLAAGVDHAYRGVGAPVEGTLLTVARLAAEAAGQAAHAGSADGALADVVAAACVAARGALTLTRHQLPVLREAGVVDAGGRGWVVLLETLSAVLRGEPALPTARAPRRPAPAYEPGFGAPAYEVQYLLADTSSSAVDRLRVVLSRLGDSVVVVGDGDLYRVHAHVDDIGGALEAGVEAGTPSRIEVTRFADAAPPDCAALPGRRPPRRAVVAVGNGDGIVRLLRAGGAVVVEGQPSAAELQAAARGTGAAQVVLLLPAELPEAWDGAADVEIAVVRTRSVVQALSALAVADPARGLADDVAAMRQAAEATRTGQVRCAVTGATTSGGVCVPGDALGLVDAAVVVVGAEVAWVAGRLLERLWEGAERVTVVLGQAAPAGLAERLCAQTRAGRPEVELVVIDGGQPEPPVLMGAE